MKSIIRKAIFDASNPKRTSPLEKKHWGKMFDQENSSTWQRLNLPGRNGNQTGKWLHPAVQHIPDGWHNIIETLHDTDKALQRVEKTLQYLKRLLQCVIETPQPAKNVLQNAIKLSHKTKQALQNGISISQYAIDVRQNPNQVSQYII